VLTYGKGRPLDAEALAQGAAEAGIPAPAIPPRPEIFPWLRETFARFFRLAHGRQIGFSGPQPLPFTDILAVVDNLDEADHIQAMDLVYMEEVMKRTKDDGHS
jgi:hypothetical protein